MCKICINKLLSKSNSNDWLEAQKEWKRTRLSDIDIEKCLCGTISSHCVLFQNESTNESCIVGRICILNDMFTDPDIIKEYKITKCDICDVDLNYKSFAGHLQSNKHLSNIASHKFHMETQERMKNYRKCKFCEQYNIPLLASPRHMYCSDCFDYCVVRKYNCPSCSNKITQKQHEQYQICYPCKTKQF